MYIISIHRTYLYSIQNDVHNCFLYPLPQNLSLLSCLGLKISFENQLRGLLDGSINIKSLALNYLAGLGQFQS